jgi:hypothetical protein
LSDLPFQVIGDVPYFIGPKLNSLDWHGGESRKGAKAQRRDQRVKQFSLRLRAFA